ncbi:MAG: hypothetical protein SF028_03180 [Candidatus Sumerlaeia bacterium]|nr:hypothetical protein [Candidatus Sumerlaeia bacterium]
MEVRDLLELFIGTVLLAALFLSYGAYRKLRGARPKSDQLMFNLGMTAEELEKLVASGGLTDEERQAILARRKERLKAAVAAPAAMPPRAGEPPDAPPREKLGYPQSKRGVDALPAELRPLAKLDPMQLEDLRSAGMVSKAELELVERAKAGQL